jgi:hypothetical protein
MKGSILKEAEKEGRKRKEKTFEGIGKEWEGIGRC